MNRTTPQPTFNRNAGQCQKLRPIAYPLGDSLK
jgi:hypothetical protein